MIIDRDILQALLDGKAVKKTVLRQGKLEEHAMQLQADGIECLLDYYVDCGSGEPGDPNDYWWESLDYFDLYEFMTMRDVQSVEIVDYFQGMPLFEPDSPRVVKTKEIIETLLAGHWYLVVNNFLNDPHNPNIYYYIVALDKEGKFLAKENFQGWIDMTEPTLFEVLADKDTCTVFAIENFESIEDCIEMVDNKLRLHEIEEEEDDD